MCSSIAPISLKSPTAVLDFEAMSWDPVQVGSCKYLLHIAHVVGLDRLDERIANVLETYERTASVHLEQHDIHTAMLAHWFCNYWSWRDRLQHGEFGHEVKERLCLRISSALSYVSKRTSDSQ